MMHVFDFYHHEYKEIIVDIPVRNMCTKIYYKIFVNHKIYLPTFMFTFFFSPSSPSQGRSVYNFPRITKQDEGSYICKGQSLAGDIEELVQIIVLEVFLFCCFLNDLFCCLFTFFVMN